MTSNTTSWVQDKDFIHEASGIMVRINKLPIYNPKFSLEVGMKSSTYQDNGYMARHVYFVKVGSLPEIVGSLVQEAQFYVSQQLLDRADQIALENAEWQKKEDAKKAFSEREAEQRKQRKQAQYGANKEARRVENRARASAGGRKEKAK